MPKSFSVITKAQLVLSSQINQTIYQAYYKLQEQFREGSLTREEAIARTHLLREKATMPEDVTDDMIDESLSLLTEESAIEDYIKEQQKREQQLKQLLETNKHLQDELKRRDAIENEAKQAQQRAELDKQKQDYIAQAWVDQRKLNRKDIWYFLKVALLNLFFFNSLDLFNDLCKLQTKRFLLLQVFFIYFMVGIFKLITNGGN